MVFQITADAPLTSQEGSPAAWLVAKLREAGVWISAKDGRTMRAVCHYMHSDSDVTRVLKLVTEIMATAQL